MRIRIEELFYEIADLSAEARIRYFADHSVDSETQREVEELLSFDSHFSTALERDIEQVARKALVHLEPQTSQCGPYRLGDLLGRGGMGTVYAAERVDGEVTHRVAVKLLSPGVESPALRERFLAERQILARLSHFNIARLLDAGHREDGQPYLVMEYVDGKPIDTYTAALSVRQKIALFLKVCAAVSYLHRNLVVHRDLKPANILVTEDGEPKLLDFGIAKILDLSDESKLTSTRILTPDYASPEQVVGGPVTTATDIYSLGAVLYRLLTGASPHQFGGDSAGAIAMAISGGRITPPSKLAPGLKGDLEVVLMKALRTEPQERYVSVDALAFDLRACLESRPVQARSADVWYRTRKLLVHYWLPASATVLVIASLSTGLYVANRERVVAERRFGELRQLSNKVIDLDLAIRTLPGSVKARQRLVSASLEYLEGLSRDAHGDVELAQEISDGYWRMARIQGVNAEFNLGDPARAEESLKRADHFIEQVLSSRPDDRRALFRSAVIAHDRMIIADTEERWADSVAHAQKTLERIEAFLRHNDFQNAVHLEGFLREGDTRQSEMTGAASLFVNVALTYVNMHRYDEGAAYARRATALAQPIPYARDILSLAKSILANALRYQGDLQGALTAIREAQSLAETAVYPNETTRQFTIYALTMREGRILGEADAVNLDRPAEAIDVLQKGLDIVESVALKDPNDSSSRARVGTAARELAEVLRDRDPARSLAVYDLGLKRLGEIRNSLKARRDRAELLAKSAYPLRRLKRWQEASARVDEALEILKRTKDYPAARIRPGSHLYAVLRAIADNSAGAGDPTCALEQYEDLLKHVLSSAPRSQAVLTDAVTMSSIFKAMEDLSRRAGRNDRASALESQRVALWRQWDSQLPNNGFVHHQLHLAAEPVE